jgi:Fe-S-cluster containining protein
MSRLERRRQLKEDERLLARGLGADELDPVQLIALMRLFYDRLQQSRAILTIEPLMAFFHENMRRGMTAGPRKLLACRHGCSHCCRAWVSARAPEVLFLKRSIKPRQRSEILASVRSTYAVTGEFGPDARDRMAVPCPLLKDHVCQVYDARPATCRTAVSEDAAACARSFQPGAEPELLPLPEFYITLRRGYSLALAGALKKASYPILAYELNAALRTAMESDDAEAAWLSGERVFDHVQTEPGGDPFAAPNRRRLYEAAWSGW